MLPTLHFSLAPQWPQFFHYRIATGSQPPRRKKSFACCNAIHQPEFDSLYVMRKMQYRGWQCGVKKEVWKRR